MCTIRPNVYLTVFIRIHPRTIEDPFDRSKGPSENDRPLARPAVDAL